MLHFTVRYVHLSGVITDALPYNSHCYIEWLSQAASITCPVNYRAEFETKMKINILTVIGNLHGTVSVGFKRRGKEREPIDICVPACIYMYII